MATITKRGKRWRVQIRHKGKAPISRTFQGKREAETWAEAMEAAREHLTLGEALRRYMIEVTPEKKGADREEYQIRRWLRHPLSNQPLAAIRRPDIASWRDERVKEGKASTTIKNALTVVSQVYVTAASEWGMDGLHNPVEGLRMPRNRPPRDRRLEVGEEGRLLAACDPLFRPVVEWAIETAMRRGEILGLRDGDIRGRTATLRDTKNGKARVVPLSSKALALTPHIPFPFYPRQIEGQWTKVCRIAGVEDLHFHDLRHEATSRLFERGLNHFEVMAITGHSSTQMLRRYTHFRAEELAKKLG